MANGTGVGWIGAIALIGGCTATVAPAAQSIDPDDGGPEPARAELAHAAGGFFEHDRSPLVPYCHGVLVAPDVVVTSSTCVADGWFELSFGVGEPGAADTVRAERLIEHPLGEGDPRHAIVALVLERAVPGVAPAELVPVDEMPCDVELPTYTVVLRGEIAPRAIWRACAAAEPDALVLMEGSPNCHGDSGAGAFLGGSRADLIGWVTTAGHLGPQHPIDDVCVTSVGLATVAANRDFLDSARELSRVQELH